MTQVKQPGSDRLPLPALLGGPPVRYDYLPYARQLLDADDEREVLRVLRSEFLTTGPEIARFEEELAQYVGARYAVAFANGTAALHAACYAAGLTSGDEVITTPMSFVATANAVLYMGGKPVFSDIAADTRNLDVNLLEQKITARTKAILAVDYAGQPADYEALWHVAHKYGLLLLEDAAHALGAEYHRQRVGSLADLTTFSFHPVKPITSGEGGVVTTNNEAFARRLALFRNHGITRDAKQWTRNPGPWYYEMQDLGFNYRLTDLQAALGRSQLKRIDRFATRREAIAQEYTAAFEGLDAIIPPTQAADVKSAWHLYTIELRLERLAVPRETIYRALQAENIGVNVHYLPVYLHPYYQRLGYPAGLCPVAEACYDRLLTLPLFPGMRDADVADVIAAVTKVLRYYSATKP